MQRSASISRTVRHARHIGFGLALVLSIGAVGASGASATVGQQEQEVKQVVAELDREHERIDLLVEQYVQALDQKAGFDLQIAASQTKIASQQSELGLVQEHLGNVAVQKYVEGGAGGLGPLFTDPADIGDGLQKDQLTRVALNAGSATTDDFEQLIKDFNAEKAKLENAQNQVVAIAASAEQKRAEAEAATVALEARLAQAKAKLGDLIDQEEQRQVAEAAAQYKKEVAQHQAQVAAAAASSSGSGNGGSSGSSSGNAGSGSTGNASSSDAGAGSSSGDTGATRRRPSPDDPVWQSMPRWPNLESPTDTPLHPPVLPSTVRASRPTPGVRLGLVCRISPGSNSHPFLMSIRPRRRQAT